MVREDPNGVRSVRLRYTADLRFVATPFRRCAQRYIPYIP